jgi:glycosyltransferase involved in cell wall biosynthesis
MPAVSVLIPCYNAADTIHEALESIAHQTFTDFEVIAVDDGSTDDTSKILRYWAQEDSRFRVLSYPHKGIIETLNAGLDNCCAPLITRMDTDDRSHPERISRQVEYLNRHPEVGLVSCLVSGFPEKQVRRGFQIYMQWLNSLLTDVNIRREIFIESPFPHPSVTFRKDIIKRIGGYQEHGWAEDYDLWLRLYLSGMRFAKLPDFLLEWREHSDRLTRTDSRYSLENFLRAKAHYLARGPLVGRDAVIIWGAGMTGRRLSKHLIREQVPLAVFIDVDQHKIGRTLRGVPIISREELNTKLSGFKNPIILAAVGARGARALIREYLTSIGMLEGEDWWCVA